MKKQEDAMRLGADHFHATSHPETFTKLEGSFDLIINAVSAQMDWNEYLGLLEVDGALVVVGIPEKQIPISVFPLVSRRRTLAGSSIGGIRETQEMLDFCAMHKLTSDIEVVPIQKVNEAYERVLKSDVRYRFVIDMASLKAS
jgi:alcohol dehydrogenase (NADP+)